jgi:hypothetical protein
MNYKISQQFNYLRISYISFFKIFTHLARPGTKLKKKKKTKHPSFTLQNRFLPD